MRGREEKGGGRRGREGVKVGGRREKGGGDFDAGGDLIGSQSGVYSPAFRHHSRGPLFIGQK